MTNTYRSISDIGKHYYGDGIAELDLSPAEEQDALNGGHLQLVPRTYKVLSDRYEAGRQGDLVELALLKETEQALIQGRHIERVDKPAAKAAEAKKAASTD